MHSVVINLDNFGLPPNKRRLTFEFIDPVWAWVQLAGDQPAEGLHWVPQTQHVAGDPRTNLYGGGLQYGEAFHTAYQSCPRGTFPMLISLHWDGSNAYGLFATPICIGLANTNDMSADTQYCIGYIPVVSDLGAKFESQATEIKFHIRNECVAEILRVLETYAVTGVRCRVPSVNPIAKEDEKILFPRLFSMNLDQPEAQLYHGMKNRWYVLRVCPYSYSNYHVLYP